ncbi:SGNH/GDSL hydrolase family protein [bacterium]|nr:SGNH/GDSL hydrolase family protein [candidate division CSSED10-310 bacterium]
MARRILIACIALLASILMVEGVVRLMAPQPRHSPWARMAPLGLSHLPGSAIDAWGQGSLVHHQSNMEGFIDVPHTPVRIPGVRRVAVLGDSFVEAIQVPLEQKCTRRLEAILNHSGETAWEVLDFGVAGAGTAGELLVYRDHARKYNPDVVILCFFLGNDVLNNHPDLDPKRDKPFLRVVDHRAVSWSTGSPGIAPDLPGGWVSGLLDVSHLARLLNSRLQALRLHRARTDSTGLPRDFQVFNRTAVPAWEEAWKVTSDVLGVLAGECAADHAELLIVAVPDRIQVHEEAWRACRNDYPALTSEQFDPALPNARLTAICADRGIPMLDLTPHLQRLALTGHMLYFPDDGHWNETGNDAAAECIAARLREDWRQPPTIEP